MEHELITLTRELLDCVARVDVEKYESLCDPSLTGIEPASMGQILEGFEFHRANLAIKKTDGAPASILSPKVRVVGDVGIVSFARINRRLSGDGMLQFVGWMETRVWQRTDGHWKQIHFHRSGIQYSG